MNKAGSILIFLGSLGALSPSLSGLYPLILISSILVTAYLLRGFGSIAIVTFVVLASSTLGLSLSGIVSVELTTVVFTAGLIAYFFPKFISISLLLLLSETPLFQILTLLVGSKLPLQLQQSAPIIIFLVLSFFVFNRRILRASFCLLITLIASVISWQFNFDILIASIINAVIFSLLFASLGDENVTYPKIKFHIALSILLVHSLFIWISSSRIDMDRILVWLPSSVDKYESQFFKDYTYTLSLAGIRTKQVFNAADIEKNSLVIVPWATDIETDQFIRDIKKSPISNSLTVLIGGEHTNYSGFSDRLNPIFGGNLWFENTTTIPPNNANHMGALWTSSILQFPFDAAFNRGASLGLSSIAVFPILIAKSIFSDVGPNEFNDFWVGDFLLGHSDRRGLTLLMAAYRDGPLWILSGDNSYLMNRYLLANPGPILNVISLATLLPMLLLQLWLIFTFCIWGAYSKQNFKSSARSRVIFFSPLLLLVLIAMPLKIYTFPKNQETRSLSQNLIYFGGDERSSAITVSDNSKSIVESKKKVFIHEIPFSASEIGTSGLEEIHIGHIKNRFIYADVKIDNCGLTNYTNKVEPKITLLEAQYCRVRGDAKIIVGDSDQASVIQINSNPPITLILDKYFLAGPQSISPNTEYLKLLLDNPNSP